MKIFLSFSFFVIPAALSVIASATEAISIAASQIYTEQSRSTPRFALISYSLITYFPNPKNLKNPVNMLFTKFIKLIIGSIFGVGAAVSSEVAVAERPVCGAGKFSCIDGVEAGKDDSEGVAACPACSPELCDGWESVEGTTAGFGVSVGATVGVAVLAGAAAVTQHFAQILE